MVISCWPLVIGTARPAGPRRSRRRARAPTWRGCLRFNRRSGRETMPRGSGCGALVSALLLLSAAAALARPMHLMNSTPAAHAIIQGRNAQVHRALRWPDRSRAIPTGDHAQRTGDRKLAPAPEQRGGCSGCLGAGPSVRPLPVALAGAVGRWPQHLGRHDPVRCRAVRPSPFHDAARVVGVTLPRGWRIALVALLQTLERDGPSGGSRQFRWESRRGRQQNQSAPACLDCRWCQPVPSGSSPSLRSRPMSVWRSAYDRSRAAAEPAV